MRFGQISEKKSISLLLGITVILGGSDRTLRAPNQTRRLFPIPDLGSTGCQPVAFGRRAECLECIYIATYTRLPVPRVVNRSAASCRGLQAGSLCSPINTTSYDATERHPPSTCSYSFTFTCTPWRRAGAGESAGL